MNDEAPCYLLTNIVVSVYNNDDRLKKKNFS